jgi:chromate transporter
MKAPTFKEALKFWLKLGFISFGGPAGQIAIMHEFVVEKKKWISESKFLHALNFCMILPGPEAQQLATYIGWMLHGTLGGLAAGILFVLPSVFMLLGLSIIYTTFGNIPWIYAMFGALKPAVIAIVILALIKIGKKSLISPFHYFVAIAGFVCIFFLQIAFPIIILGAIILSIITKQFFPVLLKQKTAKIEENQELESEYFINSNTVFKQSGFNFLRVIKQVSINIAMWICPMILFYYFTQDFGFWNTLAVFFTKAAVVTFGGAYAVLPYVAQVSVEKFHWLSSFQMMDGLALGETTPGPLIMVLAFVGYMAGYNHFGNSITMGSVGLITTTFYTFLPCFLFIFVGAPIIERKQNNVYLKQLLSIVSAAVVGVVLNLTIYLGSKVIFPQSFSIDKIDFIYLFWGIISFFALYKFKINMILWIIVSAFFGLITYFSGFHQ